MANLTNRGVEFTTPGLHIWNVPAGVESVWVRMTGAGGAGGGYTWANNNRSGAAGGGSGEYCYEMPLPCTPGGTVSVLVGAGGVASVGTGGDGGVTTVVSGLFSVTCMGGQRGEGSGIGGGGFLGAGGGPRGGSYPGDHNRNQQDGIMGGAVGLYGAGAESISHYGGSSGGGGSSNTSVRGPTGGPCESNPGVLGGTRTLGIGGTYNAGGASGASSAFGLGGQGGQGTYDENTPNHALFCVGKPPLAGAYGAGGGGAGCFGQSTGGPGGNLLGGDGAPGYVMFLWFETI